MKPEDLVYGLRREAWRLHYWRTGSADWPPANLKGASFLLGVQGGGLTITGRVLRRHPGVVSVTGGHRYWTGADEMQVVMRSALPPELRLTGHAQSSTQVDFGGNVGWAYASDELVDRYRMRADAARDPRLVVPLRRAISTAVSRFAGSNQAVFLDKSQSFTLKMPFLRAALPGVDVKFVVILRHPVAAVWRAATRSDLSNVQAPLERRVEIAVQHWINTYRTAISDDRSPDDTIVLRIEDLLDDMMVGMSRICRHFGIEFNSSLLPAQGDQLPFGSRRKERWYPVRSEINGRYLEDCPDGFASMISERVASAGLGSFY